MSTRTFKMQQKKDLEAKGSGDSALTQLAYLERKNDNALKLAKLAETLLSQKTTSKEKENFKKDVEKYFNEDQKNCIKYLEKWKSSDIEG